jgi:hypothetical protein
MSSGKSGTASPLITCDRPWGWVEVHWTNDSLTDWKIPGYTCPILEETKVTDLQKNVELVQAVTQNVPAAYKPKKGSVDAAQTVKNFNERNAFICTSVTQWIIVEIQPIIGIEYSLMDSLPYTEIWAFLQPSSIGNRKKMSAENGYVTDDLPRAGWFHTDICWFKEPQKDTNKKAPFRYIPKMSIRDSENKIANWVEIPHKLTNEEWDGLRKIHPKKPSYGDNYRYLLKIPVTVTNILTPGDRERISANIEKLARSQATSGLKKSQIDQMGRMEAGSYLKIWVRNSTFPWKADAAPSDDGTTLCMESMQRLDQAKTHPNQLFNKPAFSPVVQPNSIFDKNDINSFVESYYTSGKGMIKQLMKDIQKSCPADAVLQQALQSSKNIGIGVAASSGSYEPLSGEDTSSLLNPDHLTFPDIFKESPQEEKRYQCGADFFRPGSFRNHTWKRNRFSLAPDGRYEEDKWYYVLLWPEELLDISGQFFGDPSRASFPFVVALSAIYILVMEALSSGAKKLQQKKEKSYNKKDDYNLSPPKEEEVFTPVPVNLNKYKLPSKPVSTMAEFCKAILMHADWPFVMGTLAYYGLPNKSETDHSGIQHNEVVNKKPDETVKDTSKTMLNLFEEFNTAITTGDEPNKQKSLYTLYALLQKIFVCMVGLDELKSVLDIEKIRENMKLRKAGGSGTKKYTSTELKFFSMSASIKEKSLTIDALALDGKVGKPIPFPLPLSFLGAVVSGQGNLKLTGTINGANAIDTGVPSFGLGLSLAGSGGVHFDVGLFWTLAKELGTAFTGKDIIGYTEKSNSKSGKTTFKPEYASELDGYTFMPIVEEILDYFNAKIGIAFELLINGTLTAVADFSKFKEGMKKVFALGEKPFNCDIVLQVPLKLQISKLVWTLGHLKLPLLHASKNAAMLFPKGMTIEGDFFKGVEYHPFNPISLKKNKDTIIKNLESGNYTSSYIGSPIVLTVTGELIVDEVNPPQLDSEVNGFTVFFNYDNEKLILGKVQTSIELNGVAKLGYASGKSAMLKIEAILPFSQSKLTTDAAFITFSETIQQKDVTGTIEVKWNGGDNERLCKKSDTPLTIKKPVIKNARWIAAPKSIADLGQKITHANPYETVALRFGIDFLNTSGQCLPIKFFEINNGKKFDAQEISVVKGKGFHARAYPQKNGEFLAIVPLSALNTYNRVDEKNDEYWEFAFRVYTDLPCQYPLAFEGNANVHKNYSETLLVRKSTTLSL